VVGGILGVLEGLLLLSRRRQRGGERDGKGDGNDGDGRVEGEVLAGLLKEAREELSLQRLFGGEFWGEDGVWLFEVSNAAAAADEKDGKGKGKEEEKEEGGEVMFRDVARAHPVVRKWRGVVDGLLAREREIKG
jgi:hypothetical protein